MEKRKQFFLLLGDSGGFQQAVGVMLIRASQIDIEGFNTGDPLFVSWAVIEEDGLRRLREISNVKAVVAASSAYTDFYKEFILPLLKDMGIDQNYYILMSLTESEVDFLEKAVAGKVSRGYISPKDLLDLNGFSNN